MFAFRFWQLVSIGLLPAVALVLTACGEDTKRSPTDLDASVADRPHTTQRPINTPGKPGVQHWRTDFPFGSAEQQVLPPASAVRADGSVTTLEALAGGKPMLLYFYSTW